MRILVPVATITLLASCTSLEVAKQKPLAGAIIAPFEIASHAINTPLALLNGEKPNMVKEYDRRKLAIAANAKEERRLSATKQDIQGKIAAAAETVQRLEHETDALLARNQQLRDQIAAGNLDTARKNDMLATLGRDKAVLLVKIAQKEEYLAKLRQDATVDDMIRRREAEGLGDPVEEQINRLRSLPGRLSPVSV